MTGPSLRLPLRIVLWLGTALVVVAVAGLGLLLWPEPFFPNTFAQGKIVLHSDRPIPAAGAARLIAGCSRLLERSPLKTMDHAYDLYVANVAWHHRLFFVIQPNAHGLTYVYGLGRDAFLSEADFAAGRLVHWGYVPTPPRTLAFYCAHELTHVVTSEHAGFFRYHSLPTWVREGLADYVGIENREPFDRLHALLGHRPEDNAMRQAYGSYPHYRLLVTYFLERKHWSAAELLKTDLTEAEATAIMEQAR